MMAMWETFESRFIITGQLTTITGLRIGAGGSESAQPAASDLPVLLGADNLPFIPGSSLRGVLRSQIERIVRTLEPISSTQKYNGRGACNPVVGNEWCITNERMKALRQEQERRPNPDKCFADPDKWFAGQVWHDTCRVCQTFGSAWLASRVRIADLHLVDPDESRIERRDGVAIHREKETVEDKYDFETLPAGTSFELYITAENLSEEEFGLLWLGIQELKEGHIQVGGFKGRGLGWVKLDHVKIKGVQAKDKNALRRYLIDRQLGEVSQNKASSCLDQLLKQMGVE